MSDTILEEPLRPTVDELPVPREPVRPTEPAPPPPKRRTVAIALSIAAAAALVAAVAFYLFVVRYEPRARRHVPSNANVVMRIDLAKVALFGPVRDRLWPLLLAPSSSSRPSRAARLKEKTGVDVATDVREVVVASVDAASWVAIVGGRFRRGGFVEGLAALAREDGWSGWRREDDFVVAPGGIWIAQADDGCIMMSTSRATLTAALPGGEIDPRLETPDDAAVGFAMTREAWAGVLGSWADATPTKDVDRVRGALALSAHPALDVAVVPTAGADAAALARSIETTLAELRLASVVTKDVAGERAALSAATVATENGVVALHAAWPYDGLDRGAAELAAAFGH